MKDSLKNILNKPYPIELNKPKQLILILFAGTFITFFFLIFQPFGLKVESTQYIITASFGYGIASIIVASFNSLLIPVIFKNIFIEKSWTLWKNILYGVWYLTTISLAMVLVNKYLSDYNKITIKAVFQMMFYVVLLGALIQFIVGYINQKYLTKKHNNESEKIKNEIIDYPKKDINQKIKFSLPFGYEQEIQISNILFIESIGNYVNIAHQATKKNKTLTIRESLKELEKKIETVPFFFRCHRSYIININKIENITGDSQGLKVSFKSFNQKALISRTKIKEFKKIISSRS